MSLPFTPTYSSLSTFIQCERAYQAFYVTHEAVKPDTPALRFGLLIHALAEEYAQHNRIATLPTSDYADTAQHFKTIQTIVDQYKPKASQVLIEQAGNVSFQGELLDWENPNGLIRGRNDLICVNQDGIALLIDWKTGAFKPQYFDPQQLQWNALLVFARFPQVHTLYYCYVYTTDGFQKKGKLTRVDIPQIKQALQHWHQHLERAYQTDQWHMKRSGLCRNHCEVLACRYNGRHAMTPN